MMVANTFSVSLTDTTRVNTVITMVLRSTATGTATINGDRIFVTGVKVVQVDSTQSPTASILERMVSEIITEDEAVQDVQFVDYDRPYIEGRPRAYWEVLRKTNKPPIKIVQRIARRSGYMLARATEHSVNKRKQFLKSLKATT